MKTMHSKLILLLAIAGLLVFAAACGSKEQTTTTEADAQGTAAPPAETQAPPPAEPPPAAEPPAAAPSGGSQGKSSGGSAAPAKPSGGGSAPADGHAAEPPKPAEPVMAMVAVPEGKNITITLNDPISSKTSRPGDTFTANVKFDVQTRAHPDPIIPAGSTLTGSVVTAEKASQMKGQAKLVLKFEELKLPSGKTIPIVASLVTEGKDTTKRSVGGIAGGAAAGAILGKIIGKDTKGAAIGAVAGAAIGTGVVLGLDNKDVELPAGTDLVVNVDSELQVPVPKGA